MRYALVTGATGIVGTHLLVELLQQGLPVRALVRPGSDRDIIRRVFAHYAPENADTWWSAIEWMEGDVLDTASLADAMHGVEHFYHTAALESFYPRDVANMFEVNIGGTANVVNMALETGVQRLCHVSSIGALGRSNNGTPVDESHPWDGDATHSPYAVSKYEAELEVQRGVLEGLDAVIVNPALIMGPGTPGRSSNSMAHRLHKGTRFYPPGSNSVVDARDVAKACVALMRTEGEGERYVLAGEDVTYQRLFSLYAEAFGHPPPTWRTRSWMLELAWRLERLRSWVTGTRPMITRQTTLTARMQRRFSSGKVRSKLGFTFRNAQEAVRNTAAFITAQRA